MSPFSLSQTIKTIPLFPYETMKNDVLGKRYHLSLCFVGPSRALVLNQTYRKKSYVPNVLSFPLDPQTGEIVICPAVATKEARAYHLSKDGYIAFLFIHGLLHLKGFDHGKPMETLERRYVSKYSIT
jgi:probable rRNA maturation factor